MYRQIVVLLSLEFIFDTEGVLWSKFCWISNSLWINYVIYVTMFSMFVRVRCETWTILCNNYVSFWTTGAPWPSCCNIFWYLFHVVNIKSMRLFASRVPVSRLNIHNNSCHQIIYVTSFYQNYNLWCFCTCAINFSKWPIGFYHFNWTLNGIHSVLIILTSILGNVSFACADHIVLVMGYYLLIGGGGNAF